MKNYKILVIAILLCFDISYSQSGWVYQNPTPYLGKTHFVSSFINSNTGWAAGEGIISKTTNGGVNWVNQLDGGTIFESIFFLNSQTGYAGGQGGIYSFTSDGGASWSTRNLPNTTYSVVSIYFKDASTGFMGVLIGQIYRTTNAGLNWQIQSIDNTGGFMDFKFFNNNDGIVLASPVGIHFSSSYDAKFYKTTNGGLNWLLTNSPPSVNTSKSFFVDMNTGWSFQSYGISKTTNAGLSWVLQTNTNNKFIYSLSFTNSQTGYASGWDGTLYKTSNGGTNWLLQNVPSDWDLYSVANTDGNTCYAFGESGNVFKTSDAGNNWTSYLRFQNHDYIYDIQAITPSLIYGVGGYQNGHFHISNNGGVTWDTIGMPLFMASAHTMSFVNAQTGWIAYGYNVIMKTTNAGLSWQNKYLPKEPNIDVSQIKFFDTQTGWSVGYSYVYKTTNGGNNWIEKLNSQYPDVYVQCSFINAQTGWIVGNYYGHILKTTNSGDNWIAQDSNTTGALSVYFLNAQTGWVGAEDCIKKTTNGGTDWDSIPLLPYSRAKKIWFADAQTGWHIGQGRSIFKSTNGGYNWNLQFTLPDYSLNSMSFVNANTGWICGSNGAILKTTTGGNVFISQTSTEIPEKYSLHQNYPNPFNPSSDIKFDIHKQGIATLKVFDLLGKEMETLVDEQLSVGTYEVTFNASSLPSGIYFYVLKTGDFVESKKMILVK